jgi:two-component system C4-dicarboxylate transport sensor histidine kinase DctB
MASAGLAATQLWPDNLQGALIGVGWAVTLFLTVYLANEITQGLRRQRQRLARQKNRILAMSEQLRRQQGAMIQHEKMVALGQMAAGIAHEIANPLACMDSLLELMRRHPRHEVPVRVATVREQIRRIEQIIQQMSAFAHPGQSHGQMLGVNTSVEAALSMVRFDHRIRRVRVEQQFSDDAAGVQVESQTLVQVIVNLVMNALDAMDGSPAPRLVLRTACEGDWCLIEVADNGHGVAPEHVDHIFEPFFTTKSVGKGTGLGLAISYSLVRRLGGRIDLRTEVGKGTSFVIRWPISAMVSYSRESPAL